MSFYLVYATAPTIPGTLERAVFFHPGNAQEVMAFAQRIIGPNRRVPYQVEALNQQLKQPAPICIQMKFAAPARADSSGGGPNMGGADIPSELIPIRPGEEPVPQVTQSNLGDKYAQVPDDIRGEF
jgi:hypothetical protein